MHNDNHFSELIKQIEEFRNARNWKQFHNLKDMIISLNLEAGELLELVQWKSPEEFVTETQKDQSPVADELADILYWLLLISSDLKIDLSKAFSEKMEKNQRKYPVEKSLNNKSKYDQI